MADVAMDEEPEWASAAMPLASIPWSGSMVEQRAFNPSTATAVQTCEKARHSGPIQRQSAAARQSRPDLPDRAELKHQHCGVRDRGVFVITRVSRWPSGTAAPGSAVCCKPDFV
jgi:hypothetical protein